MNKKSKKTNPTIAFDTWTLERRFRNNGIYVYARNLLEHFREMGCEHSVEVRPFVCPGVDTDANSFLPAPGFRPRETALLKFDRLWRFGGACASAFMSGADLIFIPSSTTLPIKGLVPAIVTIHDATPVVMPSFSSRITCTLRYFLRKSAILSRAIITVSECSKKDLINIYGVPESKVSVIYNGYDKTAFDSVAPDPQLQRRLLKRLRIGKPYVLHHGTIQPRKNLKRLIEAFRLLLSRNPYLDFELVLAGQFGWRYEETLACANGKMGERGQVIFPGPLSDPDLATLIKGASLVVIPSLYEGFCLPMVESMACAIPTIAANTSCLPEISGGVLRYFDPQSVDEMAVRMEEALENERLRKELAEKGVQRANFFDWRRCAQETLALLAHFARDEKQ